MADTRGEAGDALVPRGRRRRQSAARRHRVEFSLTDEEFAALCEAAARAGLSRGAYAARAAGGAAPGPQGGEDRQLLRDALAELVRCAGQVRMIGRNLNQAVARLNATGQASADLVPYAKASIRIAGHLDQAAEQVRRAAVR
jgi:hypothetical protein